MRLDKFLCDCTGFSRTDIKKLLKKKPALINGAAVNDPGARVSIDDEVIFDGEVLTLKTHEYYILNKPAGYVCAAEDKRNRTVFDIVPQNRKRDLFTVGRLDIDTEGLLIITNDGMLSHNMLSPARHVNKTYYLECDHEIPGKAVELFKKGVDIGDDRLTRPAELVISDDSLSARLTITEGRFHQVKRMMEAVGMQVTYLKRLSMGDFLLDDKLSSGEYREFNEAELQLVQKYNNSSTQHLTYR